MPHKLLLLALAAALLAPLAATAQGLNGCPDGEFTLDTCVICLPGYSHQKTGHTGDGGKDCYACKKTRGTAQEAPMCADPIVYPVGPVEPGIFAPGGN